MNGILTGIQLSKHLNERVILSSVNISIKENSSVAIAGATGSGKTTLLKMLAGLVEHDEGIVLFKGTRVEGPLTKLIPGHPKIGYLSQYFELRNNYRVEEIFDYSNKLEHAEAQKIFELCQITHLLKRRTDQVSGGERQRIALARVLLTNPEILLLDEPFSNLDFTQKHSLKEVLATVSASFKLTTVLVSHDPADILSFADVIHIMQDGQIVQSGPPSDIYYYPKNDYVAGLFGHFAFIDKQLRELFAKHKQPINEKLNYLRPVMLSIVPAGENSVQGIVESTSFLGTCWQASVVVNGYKLICNYINSSLNKGDAVGITYTAAILPIPLPSANAVL